MSNFSMILERWDLIVLMLTHSISAIWRRSVAFGDQLKNFPLPVGQLFVSFLGRGRLAGSAIRFHQHLGNGRAQEGSSFMAA